jgi:hypothetical protein|tara:strand:+ start:2377 stop:2667 length:291 start_codon:yes stop_codon:yes gene_type:complete
MEKVNIQVNSNDIFNYVVGNSVFDPIERWVDPTRYEVLDGFIYDSETKEKITQSSEYQRFCWEVTKLKQLTDKMQRREIESVCEEIAEIAPTYVLI